MAIQNADAIQKLYVAYFNRPADYYGLEYWDKIVTAANGNTSAVSAAFAASAEYQATYAGMDLRNTINAIYKNLFGHSADVPGLDFWTNAVQTGKMSLSNAVAEIAKGAQNADKIAYESKVAAATAFTNALNTTDEILGYSGEKANAVAKQFIAGVNDAATLATAITPANLDAAVNTVIGAGATAQTFQLTKGLDNVTGTTGNDIIIGSIDAGGTGNAELNTLSSIDLINGGAGIDTLKIAHASGPINLGSLTNVEVVEITSATAVSVNSTTTTGVTDLNIVRAAGTVSATAGATTNVGVSLKDAAATTITVAGGKNVNVALTDAVSAINVGVGADADPTGAVVVSATGAASINNTNVTMGAIAVTGGSTISVTQKATVNSAAIVADGTTEDVVQGAVTIIANAATTDVTVKQDATNDGSASRAAITGAQEVATVKFVALKSGESVTVAGLTFRAAKDLSAAEVAQAFANVSTAALKPTQLGGTPATATGDTNGSSVTANGTFSGSLLSAGFAVDGVTAATSSWASGAANGDTVTFTGRANTNQADITVSSTATTAPTVTTTTQGVTSRSAWNDLGITAGNVSITGGAALKTVTVDGYGTTSGLLGASNTALTTVTLANGGDFAMASAAATVELNATDVDGSIGIGAGTKTLNANVNGTGSDVTLVSATVETLNVKGSGTVGGTTGAGAGNLNVVTAINTSGMTAGSATFTIADGTATSYTGGAGKDIVTITNGGTAVSKAVTLGAGDDTLTLNGTVVLPSATLSGGEGTDTIGMTGASAAAMSANADFAGKIDGFEKLAITNNVTTATTVNMANMDGITYVVSNNSTGSAAAATKATFSVNLTGSTLKSGDTLAFNGGTLTAAADTTANALALQLAGLSYTDWDVSSVAGATITFTAKNPGTATTAPATTTFTVTDVDANSTISQPISASTPGAAAGATMPSLTIDKLANNGTLELVALGDGVNVKMADASGSTDTLNIVTTVVGTSLSFGTVNVSGVETIKVNGNDAQPVSPTTGAASIQTGTLTVNAAGATSIVVNGNSHVNLSLGVDAKTVATVDASALTGNLTFAANGSSVVTVTGGAGSDTLRASLGDAAKADVLNGGAGTDTLYVGTNGAKLTGGAGNDTFIVAAATAVAGEFVGNKEGNTYSEITDFSAGDLLQLRAFTGGTLAGGVFTGGTAADVSVFGKLTATLNETTATFSNFVDAAVKQAAVGAAVWFNYKGDLYVVVDNNVDSESFQNGADMIVKLTGINGDNLTFNTDYGTAALI